MKTIRFTVLGLGAALAGFTLQGCFAKQPLPECQVFTGDAIAGVSNYMALLKETNHTGTCPSLDHMEIGLTRIAPPGAKEYQVLLRAQRPVDFAIGNEFSADIDATNDCSDYENTEDCSECVDPAMAMDGDNVCQFVDDPVVRVDPADPDNKGLAVKGSLTILPDATTGLCSVGTMTSNFNFQTEDLELVDGGTEVLPAVSQKMEWTNFKIMMNAKVPGTFFTANLKLTEDTCVANYDVQGFWPIVTCTADSDCDPNANPDAGKATGSGISTDFAPKCNTDIGVCAPSVDVTKLK